MLTHISFHAAAFAVGIYLGGVWDNYQLQRAQRRANDPAHAATECVALFPSSASQRGVIALGAFGLSMRFLRPLLSTLTVS